MLKIGQYFTKDTTLQSKVVSLCSNKGSCLEPSAGEGHLVKVLEVTRQPIVALELDNTLSSVCKNYINFIDFFDYPITNKFNTIFGNPPFLKIREVPEQIRKKIFKDSLLSNCNLFYYFIEKSFKHLKTGGELVFIIPREFVNSTRAIPLREMLYKNGTITHFIDYKEKKLFKDAAPNIIIIRYEKDNLSHKTIYEVENKVEILDEVLHNGSYLFSNTKCKNILSNFFNIKVGLVTGLNKVFAKKFKFSIETICSDYRVTKKKKNFIFCDEYSLEYIKRKDLDLYNYLYLHKTELINRKIKKFNENNWYHYGAVRNLKQMQRKGRCIYVNAKTRVEKPFFIDDIGYFDGSVLALYPICNEVRLNLGSWCSYLNNNVKLFEEQGLYVNNKYILTVKTLSDMCVNKN